MVFKCQENSFLKEFSSKVISCEATKFENCKKTLIDGYEIILEDTILFPEGGGQPCDYGTLNDIPVKQVLRRGGQAVHYVHEPFAVGELVKQIIDWNRRFDHMQQHSGQHLLSAVLERELNITTVSWWLGEDVCHVELDIPELSNEQIKDIEKVVNELIRQRKNVLVKVYPKHAAEDEELKQSRSVRGLPDDHEGNIRVINIEDVDTNMCCGTHVSNLSQLQVVKLLHAEKSKRKGKTLLYFLVGDRVIKRLDTCLDREQKLTMLLKNNPSEHVDLVDKLQKNSRTLNKNIQTVLKDLVVLEASKLKSLQPPPKYFTLYRKEAEPDFMNSFIKEMRGTNIFLLLATGEEKTVGNILLHGDEKAVGDLAQRICDVLDGKGAGKGTKFQAKVMKMGNLKKAVQLVDEYFK